MIGAQLSQHYFPPMGRMMFSVHCSMPVILHFLGAFQENMAELLEGVMKENTKVFQPYLEQLPVVHWQRDGYIKWIPLKVCLGSTILQYIH